MIVFTWLCVDDVVSAVSGCECEALETPSAGLGGIHLSSEVIFTRLQKKLYTINMVLTRAHIGTGVALRCSFAPLLLV